METGFQEISGLFKRKVWSRKGIFIYWLYSGDGDFQCLVKYLAKEKKLLRVIIPNQRKYSKLLSEYRKYLSFMNDLRKKLEYKKLE